MLHVSNAVLLVRWLNQECVPERFACQDRLISARIRVAAAHFAKTLLQTCWCAKKNECEGLFSCIRVSSCRTAVTEDTNKAPKSGITTLKCGDELHGPARCSVPILLKAVVQTRNPDNKFLLVKRLN